MLIKLKVHSAKGTVVVNGSLEICVFIGIFKRISKNEMYLLKCKFYAHISLLFPPTFSHCLKNVCS